jgi:hypothetical protein
MTSKSKRMGCIELSWCQGPFQPGEFREKDAENTKAAWRGGFGVVLWSHDPRPPGYTDGTKIEKVERCEPWASV